VYSFSFTRQDSPDHFRSSPHAPLLPAHCHPALAVDMMRFESLLKRRTGERTPSAHHRSQWPHPTVAYCSRASSAPTRCCRPDVRSRPPTHYPDGHEPFGAVAVAFQNYWPSRKCALQLHRPHGHVGPDQNDKICDRALLDRPRSPAPAGAPELWRPSARPSRSGIPSDVTLRTARSIDKTLPASCHRRAVAHPTPGPSGSQMRTSHAPRLLAMASVISATRPTLERTGRWTIAGWCGTKSAMRLTHLGMLKGGDDDARIPVVYRRIALNRCVTCVTPSLNALELGRTSRPCASGHNASALAQEANHSRAPGSWGKGTIRTLAPPHQAAPRHMWDRAREVARGCAPLIGIEEWSFQCRPTTAERADALQVEPT